MQGFCRAWRTLPMAHGKHGVGGSQCRYLLWTNPLVSSVALQGHRHQSGAGTPGPATAPQAPFWFSLLSFPVKIVVTRTLLISADLLAGLALATLLLGLDCIKFLKEDPRVKLKMCYGAGVTLGIGSAWPGEPRAGWTLRPMGSGGDAESWGTPSEESWGQRGGHLALP